MKHICVIQLTRIGDLIQTIQASAQLKAQAPSAKLTLIAYKKYASGITSLLNETFDEIFLIDPYDTGANQESYIKAQSDINDLVTTLSSKEITVLVNLSFSKSSSYLAGAIDAQFKLGMVRDRNNNVLIPDQWSQYVFSNVLNGSSSPFNLVDVFRKILGVTENWLPIEKTENKTNSVKNIVLHPFASVERKMFASHKWTEIIYKTLKENDRAAIHIVGSKSDLDSSIDMIKSPILNEYRHRIFNKVGTTTIMEVHKLLQKSDLFVGHDSMVGHLSAFTNTPSLTISLGSVRPHETTPYSNKAYSICSTLECSPCSLQEKCSLNQCHNSIPYQLITTSIKKLLANGKLEEKDFSSAIIQHSKNAQIYASKINKAGYYELEEVLTTQRNTKEVFRSFFKVIWPYLFLQEEIPSSFSSITEQTANDLNFYQGGIAYLYELAEFGKKYSSQIVLQIESETPDIPLMKDLSNKIDEIDKLISLVGQTYPILNPVASFFQVSKANLSGNNVKELAFSSVLNFQQMSTTSSILHDFVQDTIKANGFKNLHEREKQSEV